MKHVNSIVAIVFVLSSSILFSCKSDTTSTTPRTGTITQADLDAVAIPIAAGIVGDSFTAFESFASPADTQTSRHRLRDVFSNISKTVAISEGTIMARAAYNDAAGTSVHSRDNLFATMVMIKREPGYFPSGGDWEYAFIKYTKPADTAGHRYGLLPADALALASDTIDVTKTGIRGKLQTRCASCHANAHDNGFVFMR